jgi:uncharacterized protein (TIGR03000 family)
MFAAAGGALALLLAAAGESPAQVFIGRGPLFWPGVSYPVGPSYVNFYRPYIYNPPPTGYYGGFTQYPATTTTPLYYGATSMYYGGPAYPPGYSTAYYGGPTLSPGYPPTRYVSPPPGTGLRATSDVTSAAYETPTNTTLTYTTPSYSYARYSPGPNTIYPISPPIAAVSDNTARVEVRVPADARLWFDGQPTAQSGAVRTFRSPALEPGQDYVYEVRARWDADGKPVVETRKVTVHAGDRAFIDFNRPASEK